MKQYPKVALIMSCLHGGVRAATRGIVAFGRQHNWIMKCAPDITPAIQSWAPDGIIIQVNNAQTLSRLQTMPASVVSIYQVLPEIPYPHAGSDNEDVGKTAGNHLLELGFRNLAYCGSSAHHFSTQRQKGFMERAAESGYTPHAIDFRPSSPYQDGNWDYVDPALGRWLTELPKPVGLFCSHDELGICILDACRALNLRVPEDVAVIAADNDSPACEMANPHLSSIVVPHERIGYESAVLLDRVMHGEELGQEAKILPAGKVVQRASTDTMAISDEQVLRAIKFIRENVASSIGVEDVVAVLDISRRSLERRFDQLLKRSPLEEIRRVRIARVKQLLSDTDLSMPVIADRCGFPNAERLSVVFHEQVGTTPTNYRRQFRVYE